jgi:AraC family transcriptional regulator
MKPEIITLSDLTLVGFSARFISAQSPDANNMEIIPPLWRKLMKRKAEIGRIIDSFSYGACRMLPAAEREREDELDYLAGVSVGGMVDVPEDMTKWMIPASSYACFTHRGPITKLGDTIAFAHGTWLPISGFAYNPDAAELERYDHRFRDGGADSELDYLVPIAPKKKA